MELKNSVKFIGPVILLKIPFYKYKIFLAKKKMKEIYF